MKPSYYITTPIYYVNDRPHIGHAYTSLACDVLARFKRLDGYDVMFLTGTDEHGLKVAQSAAKQDMEPQEFTDKYSQTFRDLTKSLNLSNDDFIRTTEQRHIEACQVLWNKLVEKGDIYLGKYEGWYAVRDEAYYGEDELKAGPNGKKIAPSGAECEWMEEPSYFFRLSAWGDKLLEFYDKHQDFILPTSRRNEVISFVKAGLKDLSVSRTTFDWGIPVPNDPKHVMYVWMDALTNYITGVGYPDTTSESYQKRWPADVHIVGKDILRFHTVYWPAFLMAADLEPPKRVFAHGWWTNNGQKISKSLGNTINPLDLIRTYGLDQTRFYMLRNVTFGSDGDFSRKTMIDCINGNLANDFGNLAQRSLSMINKNCDGKVPVPADFTEADRALLDKAAVLPNVVRKEFDEQAFHKALDAIWEIVGECNKYADEQAPWSLSKSDTQRMNTVLYVLGETIRHVAVVTQPFMPDSMDKLLDQLAVPKEQRLIQHLSPEFALKPGTDLPAPTAVFPRYIEGGKGAKVPQKKAGANGKPFNLG